MTLSGAPPRDDGAASSLPAAALPFEYLSARREGVRGYAHPQDAATDEYDTVLGRGFSVVAERRVLHDGQVFVRTRDRRYVLERDLRPVRGSDFRGTRVGAGGLAAVGFQVEGRVVRPRLQPPPQQVAPGERWLDVDLQRQVLVAYEGTRPVFATLISSGRRDRTPRGTFRIWVKLLSSDMRDRERHELERRYSLEAVPWVQYFEGDFGLHAAFWHDRFGEPMSRGCINLSPGDARWLFQFTRPPMPPGWEAVLPVSPGRATAVRVW
jgi:hypothetical protein